MAIDRSARYPGRFDSPTAARPQGAFKNRTAPGAKDGSYLERDWANDWDGFFGSLMRSAGMTANGTPDTALESQYFDAHNKIITDAVKVKITGDYCPVAGFTTGDQSSPYMRHLTSGNDIKLATYSALLALLPKRFFTTADYIRIPDAPGGLIIQWTEGVSVSLSPGAITSQSVSLPITFPTSVLKTFVTTKYISGVTTVASEAPSGGTESSVSVVMHNPVPTGTGTGRPVVLSFGY